MGCGVFPEDRALLYIRLFIHHGSITKAEIKWERRNGGTKVRWDGGTGGREDGVTGRWRNEALFWVKGILILRVWRSISIHGLFAKNSMPWQGDCRRKKNTLMKTLSLG